MPLFGFFHFVTGYLSPDLFHKHCQNEDRIRSHPFFGQYLRDLIQTKKVNEEILDCETIPMCL